MIFSAEVPQEVINHMQGVPVFESAKQIKMIEEAELRGAIAERARCVRICVTTENLRANPAHNAACRFIAVRIRSGEPV